MGKKTEAGAAQTAAPRQTVETAAEAGLPITQPEPTGEEPAKEQPTEDPFEPEQPAPVPGIDVEACRNFHENMPTEDFETVLEIVLAEAHRRGIVTTDEELLSEFDEEDEDEPEDEHAEARELLCRYKLPQAWQDETGAYHFDEKAALKAAGGNADSLTVILPEINE